MLSHFRPRLDPNCKRWHRSIPPGTCLWNNRGGLRDNIVGLRERRDGLLENRDGLRENRDGLRDSLDGLRENRLVSLRDNRGGLGDPRASNAAWAGSWHSHLLRWWGWQGHRWLGCHRRYCSRFFNCSFGWWWNVQSTSLSNRCWHTCRRRTVGRTCHELLVPNFPCWNLANIIKRPVLKTCLHNLLLGELGKHGVLLDRLNHAINFIVGLLN